MRELGCLGEVHAVLSGGLAVGFGSEDAQCINTPRIGAGSRGDGRSGEGRWHRPLPGRTGAHRAVGPRGVKDRGGVGARCSISRFPWPGPAFPVSGNGRKITAGQRSSPKASAHCCHVRGHICRCYQQHALGGDTARCCHVSVTTPSSQPVPGTPDISVPVASGSAQPRPRRAEGLVPPLWSLFLINC